MFNDVGFATLYRQKWQIKLKNKDMKIFKSLKGLAAIAVLALSSVIAQTTFAQEQISKNVWFNNKSIGNKEIRFINNFRIYWWEAWILVEF